MKRGKQIDTWYPFYIDKWLFGSTRHELIIRDEKGNFIEDLRGIFADLLTLSKKDGGYIRANETTPYPISQLAGMFCVPEEKLRMVIDICLSEKVKKIRETAPGIYYVISTETYSLSDRHRRRMAEIPDPMSDKPDTTPEKEDIRLEENREEDRIGNKLPSSDPDPQPIGKFKYEKRHLALSKYLEAAVKENVPYHVLTGANRLEAWAHEFRIMEGKGIEGKGIPFKTIMKILEWSQRDPFWAKNILSAATFRSKFGRLEADSRDPSRSANKEEAMARDRMVGRTRKFEDDLAGPALIMLPEIDAAFEAEYKGDTPATMQDQRDPFWAKNILSAARNEYRVKKLTEIFG